MTIKKDDGAPFLSRWSRLKQEAREESEQNVPAKADETQPAPELPPIDQLSPDSDFTVFMDKRVDARLRRMALKKLFTDPRFNVTDGLDDYAEDFSALEDLSKEMVDGLQHARRVLRGPEPDEAEKGAEEEPATTQPKEQPADQVATRSQERPGVAEGGPPAGEAGTPGEPGKKDERQG